MAQNETWLTHDLMNPVKVQYLAGNLFSMDNAGNLIGVTLTKDSVAYSGGGSVSANVIRADGGTVAVSGALSGNVATVVLPAAAYFVPGVTSIVVKLTVNGEITTVAAVVVNVYKSSTDTAIDPGTIIPSIQTLIDQIDTAVASIPADYSSLWTSLAPAFSTSTAYTAGRYVTYNSGLYRFIADHVAGDWSSSDVTSAKLGNDIADLKSAINAFDDELSTSFLFTDGKYIVIPSSGTLDPTKVGGSSYECMIISVKAGEQYRVNTSGGATPRSWCLTDGEYTIVALSESNAIVDDVVTVGSNGYLAVNNKKEYTSGSVSLICDKFHQVQTEISRCSSSILPQFIPNKYVNTLGVVADQTGERMVSENVPCIPGITVYYRAETNSSNVSAITFYKNDGTVLATHVNEGKTSEIYSAIAPANTEYFILSTRTNVDTKLYFSNSPLYEITSKVNPCVDKLNSVTEEQKAIDNIYNPATITPNKRLGTSGQVVDAISPSCYVSDFIPLEVGKTYKRLIYGDNYHRISVYRSDKTTHQSSTTDGEITASNTNWAYARICGYTNEINGEKFGIEEKIAESAIDREARSVYENNDNAVDLIVFAGQSNMAGRGITSETWPEKAPVIIPGAGYEFRAVSDPTKLYPMYEPFGSAENDASGQPGFHDGTKSGSMAVAFTNAYYTHNGHVPVVGVSASEGDTSTEDWMVSESGKSLVTYLINRMNTAATWLTGNGYKIRHKFCLWCQGEADGSGGTATQEAYKDNTLAIFNSMFVAGIEKVFLVRIGQKNNTDYTKYDTVIADQTDICKTVPNVVMASTDFVSMRLREMMKDQFHYYQAGYNECGTYAGINVASYVTTGKEPTMYDPFSEDLYYSHKN